jgi:hypothetical protein
VNLAKRLKTLTDALLEARPEYLRMFDRIVAVAPEARTRVESFVDRTESLFRRMDRVVWFLRWYRVYLAQGLLADHPDLQEYFDWLVRGYAKKSGHDEDEVLEATAYGDENQVAPIAAMVNLPPDEYLLQAFAQSFDLGIPEIEGHQFTWELPMDVIPGFMQAMMAWQSSSEKALSPQQVREQKARDLIVFPDGWKWVHIPKEACAIEGRVMKHCGNVGVSQPGDTILSLRRPVEKAGETWWEPQVDFILHADGTLGERKGRANSKPKREFHPYIERLLREPMVKGFRRSEHNSENDFKLVDLGQAALQRLLQDRPEFRGQENESYRRGARR